MKRSVLFRLLSMLLVFAMLVELLPAGAFAAPDGEETPSAVQEGLLPESDESEGTDEQDVDTTEAEKLQEEACVVGEVMELREEGVKHFRMDDGSFIAVDYGMPVHFSTDGGESWEPIDNTLVLTDAEATVAEQGKQDNSGAAIQRYSSSNGDKRTTFASDLQSGFLFSAENGDHKICMSLPVVTDDRSEATGLEDIDSSDEVILELLTEDTETDESSEPDELEPSDNSVAPTEAAEEETEDQNESEAPMVAEEDLDETAGDTATVEANAETNTAEAFNTAASAEVSYPQDQQKQPDRGNPEEENSNDYASRSLEEQVMPSRLTTDVLYRDVYDGVDLSYELCGYDVKENIVVKSRRDSYSFTFHLNTGDLVPIMQEDGSILFVDNEDQGIYLIPAPYMYDAEGTNSNAVSYSLSEAEDRAWALTVTADAGWINAEDRVLPITIDPTLEIITSSNSKSIISSYVRSNLPDASPSDNTTFVDVGTTSSSIHRKGLIYIKDLPNVPNGALVTGAQLAMFNAHGPTDDQYVNIYSSTSTVANSNPEYYLNHATWNGIASIPYGGTTSNSGKKILDYAKISANETGWCSWNITSLVQSWYDGSGPSRLLVLEGAVNTGSPYVYFRGYKSSNSARPTLVVHYQNMVGLEGSYSYQSQDLGLAGSGSVNNYTLGLTIAEALSTSDSVALPFTFGLYYNSDRAENKCTKDDGYITRGYSGHAGQGWKLSVQQTVYSLRIDEGDGNNVFYLVYLDEDGTEHYFKYDDTKSAYIDEDGLNLSITISTSSDKTVYTMTDDNKNTWEFFNGYLTTYTDYHGNNLFYIYDGATYADGDSWKPSVNHETHKVTKVLRKNNGGELENLLSLSYNSNGCLSSITERGNRVTSFSYESRTVSGNTLYYLKEISFPGSRKAKYQYVNYMENNVTKHLLIRAYDSEANYGIQYSYFWKLNDFRIKNIYEYHLQDNQEETRNKMHMHKSDSHHTTARFYGADMQSTSDGSPSPFTVDDIITVYNFDDWGHVTSTYSKDGTGKILGAATAAYTKKEGTKADNNRMTHAAQTGASSRNLLDNGGIESAVDAWTYWEYNGSYAHGIRADSTVSGQIDTGITPNHGQFALKTYVSSSSAGSTAQAVFYRPVTLQANETYTLSAYLNTKKITDFRYKNVGIFFSLPAASNPLLPKAYDSIDYKTTAMASGWERLSVTYTAESTAVYWVGVCQNGPAGVVYYDDIQLEQSDAASSINLLSCGSFERSDFYSYWNRSDTSNVVLATGNDNVIDETQSLMIQGSVSTARKASQSVSIKKSAKTTFILSGWAKAESAPNAQNDDLSSWKPFFGLIASVVYENSSDPGEQHRIPFNSNTTTWQYTSGVVVPKHPERSIDHIDVFVSYYNNINTAYFDNICLSQEPVQTYSYDSETGKLLSSTQTENDESTYQYDDDHRLTQYQTLGGVTFQKTYVGDKRDPHTVVSDGLTTTYYYDYDNSNTSANAGNVTGTKVEGLGTNKCLESSATYDSNSNYQLSTTSSNQITTSKTYDTYTDRVMTSTIPLGNGNSASSATIHHTYYPTGRAKSIYQESVANITYDYNQFGNLDKLKRKTFRNGVAIWQAYDYDYDDWGQLLGFSVKKSAQADGSSLSTGTTVIAKEYYPNGNLRENSFSNGDRIDYYYDNLDRKVREEYYNSNDTMVADYRYVYDAQGNLAKQYAVDNSDGSHSEEYRFEYDSLGRQIRSRELASDGSTIQLTEHLYDTANRLSDQRWMVAGREFYEQYTYNNPGDSSTPRNDGSLASMRAATGDNVVFTYDNLKRLTRIDTKTTANTTRFYTAISYRDIGTGNQTTNQISGYSVRTSAGNIINYNKYYYDAAGNIKKITQILTNNTERVLSEYKYDSMNQLIQEDQYFYSENNNSPTRHETITYTYDTAGNILSTTESGIDTIECTYGDSNWPDLLTKIKVNGTSKNITYQNGGAGNPDNWYNGREYTNLTWTQGRLLTGLKKGNTNISYTYDMEGIRTGKQSGNISHNYITQDGKVVRDSFNGTELFFIYDNNDKPYALQYSDAGSNPVTFYYMLNEQGDVIGLLDGNANQVVSYTYDAWGNILSSQCNSSYDSNLDQVNPLRYRGYYYDTETGWYYIQSRYYDPAVKRFINADSYCNTDQSFIGNNMFAYCNNSPVGADDSDGHARRRVRSSRKVARKRSCSNVQKRGGRKNTRRASSGMRKILEAICSKKEEGNTFSVAVSYCTGGGSSGRGQTFALTADTSYNYATQVSDMEIESSGGGTSASLLFTYTNGRDYKELDGESAAAGVTIVELAGITVDYITFSPEPGEHRWGLAVGICLGAQEDIHTTKAYTTTTGVWNPIKGLLDRLYE